MKIGRQRWVARIEPVAVLTLLLGPAGVLLGQTDLGSAAEVQRRAVEVEGVVQTAVSSCSQGACQTFLRTVPWDDERLIAAVRDDEPLGGIWVVEDVAVAEAAGRAPVRRLVADLPLSAGGMTVCRDQGETTLMIQAGGSVFFVDPAGVQETQPRAVRIGSASWSAPASAWSGGCGELFLVGDGRARLVRLAGSGARRSLLSSTEFLLPTEVRRNPSGLTLETPTVRRLGSENNRVVIGPRSYDNLRLESVLFEPTPAVQQWLRNGGPQSVDPPEESLGVLQAWSRLPAPEEVLESDYRELHGRSVLVVVSQEADKVGLLERKKLRIFELGADRSRTGRPPFFQTLTASRLWQDLDLEWIDLDGDGLEDLVLLQPEGLAGEALLVDAYLATGPLAFASKARRSRLKTDQSGWTLRHDWTGDGLPDVLVQDAGFVQVYPASLIQPRRRKRGASVEWAETPTLSFELTELAEADSEFSTRRRMWVDDGGVVVASSPDPERSDEEGDDGNAAEGGGAAAPAEVVRSIVELFRPGVSSAATDSSAPGPDP